MISRLILVGMVGVMGVSLPDGVGWKMPLPRARAGTTACVAHRAAVAFEPLAVDGDPSNRIADKLNRRSEGLDIPAAPIVRVATIPPRTATESDKAVERLFADNQVWGEPATEALAKSDAVVDRPFADNEVWGEPATEALAESDKAVERLFADNQVWGEPTAPIRRPEFDPIAVADGVSSLADELNCASEGLTTAHEPEPTIGTALKLTHEAALAWLNVLAKTIPTEDAAR